MTDPKPNRPTKPKRPNDPVRNGLVIVSMTVVALALGIGLHLQFALAFWLAVVAALSVYVALLSTHILVRRSERLDALQREVTRLEAKAGKSGTTADGFIVATGAGAYQPPSGAAGGTASVAQGIAPSLAPAMRPAGAAADQPVAPTDHWNFAPTKAAGIATPAAAAAPLSPQPTNRQREDDAEKINAVIRKLAADITQGQAAMDRTSAPAPAEAQRVAPPQPDTVAGLPGRGLAMDAATAADLDDSVAALHAAADAMREAGREAVRTLDQSDFDRFSATRRIAPTPPPLPNQVRPNDPARNRLAAVAEALERERFDIMLEPILGLGDRRAQHYVVSVRLRDGLGDSVTGFGIERTAPGSGLLPLLDAVKVEGAARVAWRMEDRAKSGALFSQLAGESLVSDRFLNRFADTYRQGDTLSGRLVLSFRQTEVRTFSELQWSTLRDMADLGFRFCLDDITTLDLDFASLAAAGFTFARLDADTFVEGLPIENDIIPAGDICRHFAGLGLTVIVAGIADEAVARRLQSYGVELGHGGLFGGARPVKADVLRNPHAAVA